MSTKTKALLLLGLTVLIWGLSYPITRLALQELSPPALAGLRFLFGSLSLLPMALRQRQRPTPLIYTGWRPLWLWAGLLVGAIISLGSLMQTYALTRLSSGQVSFMSVLYCSLVPILALIMGYVPRPLVLAGLAVSLAGLYLLTGGSGVGLDPAAGLVMAANFFWAAQIVAAGYFVAKVNTWLLTLAQNLAAGLLLIGVAAVCGLMPTWDVFIRTLPFTMWGILSTGVAYLCQTLAQRDLSATAVATVLPLQCVIAAGAGVFFLNEVMTSRMAWGAGVIILGSFLAKADRESVRLTPEHRRFTFLNRLRLILAALCGLTVLALMVWSILGSIS